MFTKKIIATIALAVMILTSASAFTSNVGDTNTSALGTSTSLSTLAVTSSDIDPIVTASSIPNDSLYASYQSNTFSAMAITDAWSYTRGSSSIIVAVIDSGVDFNHPDLSGRLLSNGYDFVNQDKDPSDDYGHGTVVAGIIAANSDNSKGVAGVTDCKILPIKVLNSQGKGYASNIAEGIIYAADNGANVINLSCGTPVYSKAVENAVNYAHDKGIVVIASTGNTGSAIEYPAACKNAIAVGAVTVTKEYADYSCFGKELSLVAVGTNVASTTYSNGKSTYANATGTSFSAPFVSALAAMSLSLDGTLKPDELKSIMEATATDLGAPGWDDHTGYGIVDFTKTLKSVEEKAKTTDATPVNDPLVQAASSR